MIKWFYNKFINENNPKCMCGWNMKPFDSNQYIIYQWKCIWAKCKWETFQDGNSKFHWWTRERIK